MSTLLTKSLQYKKQAAQLPDINEGDCLYKTAIDLTGLRRINDLLKTNLIRRNLDWVNNPVTAQFARKGSGMMAHLPTNEVASQMGSRALNFASNINPVARGKILAQGPTTKILDRVLRSELKNNPTIKLLKDTLMMDPSMTPADLEKMMSSLGLSASRTSSLKKLAPLDKEVFNRIMLQHEGLEKKYSKLPFKGMFESHINPQVILEESNMVRSLPEKHKDVLNSFVNMRSPEISALKQVMPSFEYGTTRLSRHARKHLGNLIQKNAAQLPDINEGDTIYGGRFKNIEMKVKGLKKDENNQPVVETNRGDRKALTFRVEKLMDSKND